MTAAELFIQFRERKQDRPDVTPEDVCREHPELLQAVERLIHLATRVDRVVEEQAVAKLPSASWPTIPGYRMLREIVGGMGRVFIAQEIEQGRFVAIKQPFGKARLSAEQVQRFQRESRVLESLEHPNVVKLLEVGRVDDAPYFVMEFIDGGTLESLVPMEDCREAARLVKILAEAVAVIHSLGIVHRDLKPRNVLITRTGELKIADFGLARWFEAESENGITGTGAVMGTAAYMANEQAAGLTRLIGPLTDVHGLGAILYTLLTGTPPYGGQSREEILRKVASDTELPRPVHRLRTGVDKDLETICMICLRKDPAERYPSSAELAAQLGRFLEGRSVVGPARSVKRRIAAWSRRRPRTAAALSTGMAGIMVLAFLMMTTQKKVGVLQGENQQLVKKSAASRKEIEGSQKDVAEQLNRRSHSSYAETIRRALKDWLEDRPNEAMLALATYAKSSLRGWEWSYLNRLIGGGRPLATLHQAVTGVAYHPKGGSVALVTGPERDGDPTAKQSAELVVWDTANQKRIFTIPGGPKGMKGVAFDADGSLLGAINGDISPYGGVQVWDARTRESRFTWDSSPWLPHQLAFAPDGSWFAVACVGLELNGALCIRSMKAGLENLTLPSDTPIFGVAVSPDGRRLLAASSDDQGAVVKVWEQDSTGFRQASSLRPDHELRAFDHVAISRDGRYVAASGTQQQGGRIECFVWDLADGKQRLARAPRLPVSVEGLAFSPDGADLAACLGDGSIEIWGLQGADQGRILRGHTNLTHAIAYEPEGRRLVSASEDRTIRIWDADQGVEFRTLPGTAEAGFSVATSPEGAWLATGDVDNMVRIWSLSKTAREPRRKVKAPGRVLSVRFDASGHLLAAAGGSDGQPGFVRIWGVATEDPREFIGHTDLISDLVFAGPLGAHLVSAGRDAVRVWEAGSRRQLTSRTMSGGYYFTLASTPPKATKSFFAAAGFDRSRMQGRVTIWDAQTMDQVREINRPLTLINGLAFSRDGARLAIAERDPPPTRSEAKVEILSTDDWSTIVELPGRAMGYYSVDFSPDGLRLVTFGRDGFIRLWDSKTGDEILTLPGKFGDGGQVRFSQDGRQIIAAREVVRVWDSGTD